MRNRGLFRLPALSVFLLCVISSGCTKLQEPRISDISVTECDIKGLTSADVCFSFTIGNPNKKSLSAESATGEIFINGASIAEITLTDAPLTAPAQSTSTIKTCFNIRITDPLSMLAAGISLRDPDLRRLTADADISIRIGSSTKKIRIRDFPLSRLSSYLNIR